MSGTAINIRTLIPESDVEVDLSFDGPDLGKTLFAFNKVMNIVAEPLKPLTPQEKLDKYYREKGRG